MAENEAATPTDSAAAATISSEIMVATVIFLFMVVVFVFVLYLYAKRYVGANPMLRRSRFVFAAEDAAAAAPAPRRGLDPAVLAVLRVVAYGTEDFKKEGLECAVCLSEVSEGERIRLLPDCDHGFHVECIDMWFHSHSTCPLCRTLVGAQPDSAAQFARIPRPEAVCGNGPSRESPILPTNVQFWGTRDGVSAQEGASSSSPASSSSSRKEEGVLVIEIPRRGFPGSPSPISPMEERKSPSLAKLRSLKRLLSRGKPAIGASCSPNGGDIELGGVGVEGH